jgi:hypothetical protein
MSEQMRAAWARRPDVELLHAFFLEELSSSGRAVIQQLVLEKVGPLDAYLAGFERAQGELVAAIPVRGCEVGDAPAMWGHLVLTTCGIGFVPEGFERHLVGELASDVADVGLEGLIGGILASAASPRRADPIPSPSVSGASRIPLPLLASIEPGAAWWPRSAIQELLSSLDVIEVIRDGERALCATLMDDDGALWSWAEAHDIPFALVDPALFPR